MFIEGRKEENVLRLIRIYLFGLDIFQVAVQRNVLLIGVLGIVIAIHNWKIYIQGRFENFPSLSFRLDLFGIVIADISLRKEAFRFFLFEYKVGFQNWFKPYWFYKKSKNIKYYDEQDHIVRTKKDALLAKLSAIAQECEREKTTVANIE